MTTYRTLRVSLPKPENVAGRAADRLHQHLIGDLYRRLEAVELAIEKVAGVAEMNPWARTLLENALHYAECSEEERDEIDAGIDDDKEDQNVCAICSAPATRECPECESPLCDDHAIDDDGHCLPCLNELDFDSAAAAMGEAASIVQEVAEETEEEWPCTPSRPLAKRLRFCRTTTDLTAQKRQCEICHFQHNAGRQLYDDFDPYEEGELEDAFEAGEVDPATGATEVRPAVLRPAPAPITTDDTDAPRCPVFGNPRDIAHARGFYNEALLRLKYGGEL